jgi:hypothetical protein
LTLRGESGAHDESISVRRIVLRESVAVIGAAATAAPTAGKPAR